MLFRSTEPRRTCVGCRRTDRPEGWIRIAATREGAIEIGRTAAGRGAWICSGACFARAAGRGMLARALRRELTSTEVEGLRARLESINF